MAERAAHLGTVRRPLRQLAVGRSDVRRQQSDLHVGVFSSRNLFKFRCVPHSSDHAFHCTTLSFRKLSTMGIKGVLAADIGQLSNLQSLSVKTFPQACFCCLQLAPANHE
jgi:hypothetical protein